MSNENLVLRGQAPGGELGPRMGARGTAASLLRRHLAGLRVQGCLTLVAFSLIAFIGHTLMCFVPHGIAVVVLGHCG